LRLDQERERGLPSRKVKIPSILKKVSEQKLLEKRGPGGREGTKARGFRKRGI